MASIFWGRDPQDAYDNPYEYDEQDQFVREARELLSQIQVVLDHFTMEYHKDDFSLGKATWMLAVDLNDSLLESIQLLEEKRHRIAFRLFRDAVETIDILQVLHSKTPRAQKALQRWYENETIPHRESRMHIELHEGKDAAEKRREYYTQLSKFTHRTYRALLKSYSLGRDDMLVHDSRFMRMLAPPETIATGLAVLADLIIQATECLKQCGALTPEEVANAWLVAIELHIVPRRFAPKRTLSSYK
jgi:hypothetical protein